MMSFAPTTPQMQRPSPAAGTPMTPSSTGGASAGGSSRSRQRKAAGSSGMSGINLDHFGFKAQDTLLEGEVARPEITADDAAGGSSTSCTPGSGRKTIFNLPAMRCGMGAMDDAVDVFESVDRAKMNLQRPCGGDMAGGPCRPDGGGSGSGKDPIMSFRADFSHTQTTRDDDESTYSTRRSKPPVSEIHVERQGGGGGDRGGGGGGGGNSSGDNPAATGKGASDRSHRTRSTAGSTKFTSDSSLTNTHDDDDIDVCASTAEDGSSYTASGGELLFDLLTSRQYGAVSELLKTTLGRDMAAVEHIVRGTNDDGSCAAYPLHLICDYERDFSTGRDRANGGGEVRDRDGNLIGVRGKEAGSDGGDGGRPPADVIAALLEAYPDAAKKRGYDGRLPLHHAARRRLPSEAVSAIIRSHPRALDVRDYHNLTPRDYARQHYTRFLREVIGSDRELRSERGVMEHAEAFEWNALLERPSSCWMQQVRDEETQRRMDSELQELENEVEALAGELERSVAEERALEQRLDEIENNVGRYEERRKSGGLDVAASKAEDGLESQLREMERKLVTVVERMEMQYADDVRERKQVAEFSDDVKAVYEDIRGAMDEIELELQTMKMMVM